MDVVKYLVMECFCNVNEIDNTGQSGLNHAFASGQMEMVSTMVEVLVNAGADLFSVDALCQDRYRRVITMETLYKLCYVVFRLFILYPFAILCLIY